MQAIPVLLPVAGVISPYPPYRIEVSASRLSSQVSIWEPSAAAVFPSPHMAVTSSLLKALMTVADAFSIFAAVGVLVGGQGQLVHADLAAHVRGDLGRAEQGADAGPILLRRAELRARYG